MHSRPALCLRFRLSRLGRLTLLILATGSFGGALVAQASPSAVPEVERDYEVIVALSREETPANIPASADNAWTMERNGRLHQLVWTFLEKYPAHPRRWDAILFLRYTTGFQKTIEVDGQKKTVRDSEGLKTWKRQLLALLGELLLAPDAGDQARRMALSYLIRDCRLNISRKMTADTASQLAALDAHFDELEHKYPRSKELLGAYQDYIATLDTFDPQRCLKFLVEAKARHVSDEYPDPQIRDVVEGRLRLLLGQAAPVWMQLATLSGQPLDIATLRGKVVLIAIYADAQVENVRKLEPLYRDYHARGLEVIQVIPPPSRNPPARDQASSSINAPETTAPTKTPWPVVYDEPGTGGILPRHFGINWFPAWLLIARDGRIATSPSVMTLRELEQAIRQELDFAATPTAN
jgi:hypothetical protein